MAAGWVCVLLALAAFASPAAAHRLRPAVVTATFDGTGGLVIAVDLNLEAALAGIGPEHRDTRESDRAPEYEALRRLPPAELESRFAAFAERLLDGVDVRFDGQRAGLAVAEVQVPPVGDTAVERVSTLRLRTEVPRGAKRFTWRYSPDLGESALRIATAGDGIVVSQWLRTGEASEPFPLGPGLARPRTTARVLADYALLGFTHIVPLGADHILFVLGLFLLSLHWRPLLYQITAFTVAHTITLALSVHGLVSLPGRLVEPLIALSIVYVAVENIFSPTLRPWRVAVVFAFGLLHGLGFAGVLVELGLPEGEYLSALVGFNVGVELGQLAVVAIAFATVGVWFGRRAWYRQRVVVPGSAAIALVGAYWTVERVLG